MTDAELDPETDPDDAIIVALSDYLDGALTDDAKADVERKLATDDAWKAAHAEMVETREALSGLQKARAPVTFAEDVTSTIHKRSAGRFFGRKTFGDRVPFGALLVVALLALVIIGYVMYTSQTGSLKVDRDHHAPPAPHGTGIVDQP
jgi:anti-sigma factor RsiW